MISELQYPHNKTAEFDQFLSALEVEFGGVRQPWGVRGGAIDLVNVLEISLVGVGLLALKTVGGKYLEGLLDTDSLKAKGGMHRKRILETASGSAAQLINLTKVMLQMTRAGLRDVFEDQTLAISLSVPLGNLVCYVVINHDGNNERSFETLPAAIARIQELQQSNAIPADASVSQLYFDKDSGSWDYLFIPTNSAFGHHIDRYVDLHTGEVYLLESNAKFIELFQPSDNDKLKFLVSPFMAPRTGA